MNGARPATAARSYGEGDGQLRFACYPIPPTSPRPAGHPLKTPTLSSPSPAAESPYAPQLEGASYWRGERVILRDVDWSIRRGEHWALLGANGSGKTTLLRMVAATEWPCDGSIRVLGQTFGAVDLRELHQAIGLVTSTLAAYFHDKQSALEIVQTGINAELGWWRQFGPDEEARARQGLAAVGLQHLASRLYVQL